ncbi:hypothetical protein [Kribbella sp. CA-293567]|uniref:hypothetical protein n=1 Tax=Kribbella sp. CA-293567 TaxID=3002436 RepID=UPI0022DE6C93|nr:hypothetical protein [Kribbella sp. CA-293567]WBQ03827.1 hypothetical protein OX958_28135 [Kribbella sp. CA-293567]
MATRTLATLRDGIPLPFDCKPFRGPKLTNAGKPFEPKPRAAGDRLEITGIDGAEVLAEVWGPALGAGCVWAVADNVAYLVSKSGAVLENRDYRRPAAEVAA